MGLMRDAIRGAVAGTAATWVMDLVTQGMLDGQPPDVTAREEAARVRGQAPVPNLVDRLTVRLGLDLGDEAKARAEQAIHFGLGAIPGALYAVLRRRLPLIGAGGGLVFGVLLWLGVDEYANAAIGLASPPEAYPPQSHLRGLVGHAILGAMTDSGIDLLGG